MPAITIMLIAMKTPAISLCLGMLFGFCETAFATVQMSGTFGRAVKDFQHIAIALNDYANEHEGRLPRSIAALVTDYDLDSEVLARTTLTMPGVQLGKLPSNTIIAFLTIPEDPSRMVALYAAGYAGLLKVGPNKPAWAIVVGVSGWLVALVLWKRLRSREREWNEAINL